MTNKEIVKKLEILESNVVTLVNAINDIYARLGVKQLDHCMKYHYDKYNGYTEIQKYSIRDELNVIFTKIAELDNNINVIINKLNKS